MNTKVENLTSLLELPGLSGLIKLYTNCSINADNIFMNRKQLQSKDHENTINIFSYGDLVLYNPTRMFLRSLIQTFTSKGTIMLKGDTSFMFYSAISFNSDVSAWDVEHVTDASSMFYNAVLFNSDLSNWKVGNIIYMSAMFLGGTSFNSDISEWNVENVTNMSAMFLAATSFRSDLCRWNVSKVEYEDDIFTGATSFDRILSPDF
jgi:surface protein